MGWGRDCVLNVKIKFKLFVVIERESFLIVCYNRKEWIMLFIMNENLYVEMWLLICELSIYDVKF